MHRLLNTLLVTLFTLLHFTAPLSAAPISAAPRLQATPDATDAALTTAFTYQGQLKRSGELVAATCTMSFSLFDAFTGGTQIGNTQVIDTVNVSNGLFTVALNGAGEFGPNAFNGSARFLEIALLCPGDAEAVTLPRQPLTATPYAITSLSAEGLQGRPVSASAPGPGQALAWDGTQWTPQTLNNGAPPLDWNSLSGIPAGFADNVDNEGLPPDWNIITNMPAGFADGVDNEGPMPDWNTLPNIPAGFADNVDNDSGGDITGVSAGSGLTGGSSAGEVALALDTNVTDQRYWGLRGNADVPAEGFLGTTNNVTLNIGANNAAILRLIPEVDSSDSTPAPNIVGGALTNNVTAGVIGATIAGGGRTIAPNTVFDDFSMIGGGTGNQAGSDDGNSINDQHATIAGGRDNRALSRFSFVGGGQSNQAEGNLSVISGGEFNQATGSFSMIPGGKFALAHLPGQFAIAGGAFNNEVGSAQMSIYTLRAEGTGSQFLLMEGGQLLTPRPGTSMVFTIFVIGRAENGNSTAAFRLEGAIVAGDVANNAFISFPPPVKTTLASSDSTAALFNVRVEAVGGSLRIVAENLSIRSVRWVATVYATEVAE